MDYNKSLKKDIIPYIINNILSEIDANSESWVLKINSYTVKESKKPYDYFKNENKSCLVEVVVDYTISAKVGGKAPKGSPPRHETVSIFIPQMIKSSFILDGKTRTHESYFDKGNDLDIHPNRISFKGFTYRIEDNMASFYVRGVGHQLLPIDDITDPSKFDHPEFEDTLKLDMSQRKKIRIIYGFDPGKKITKEALLKMASSYMMSMRDHVVTKQLITVDRALYMHLEKVTYKLLRGISAQFFKAGNLYITGLQNAIYNFFKNRSESVNPVHYPENFNELSYLIASKKVILETGADQKKELKVAKTRYNPTFFDVVDAAVSPDGKNINRKNELAQAIEVNADGSVNIKVYDKKFNTVSIELLDYMLADILHYEEVNYRTKKVISSSGPYKVKHKGETKESDKYDFIDLHPDERLATTSRLIPMMNSCDSVRVSMGAKMLSQTISTKSSEPPLIATGHENIKEDSPLAFKWDKDEEGKVVEVDEFKGVIKIETSSGKNVNINLPSPVESQQRLTLSFIPPKVGQKLKKGDLVYHSDNLASDGQLRLGQNLKTAFMYYHGLEFEDSVIVSESCAKKLTHLGEYVMVYDIREGETLEKLLEPGRMANSLDKRYVISVNKELSYTQSQEGLNNLVKIERKYTKEVGMKLPNNLIDTILVDVQYKEFIHDEDTKKRLDRVSSLNYKTNPNSEISKFVAKHGNINARRMELPTEFPKNETKGVAYKVFLKFIIANVVKNGDKVTNRFGSKGVISKVVPDNEMIRDEHGRVIDIILNPSSVIARKNLPQTGEAVLSKISEELWIRVDRMNKDTPQGKENIKALLDKYHFEWLVDMKWSEFLKYHESLRDKPTKYQVRTGSYSVYTPLRIAEIQEELDISDKEFLIDGKRNRVIKTPILTGWTYILKLHHMSDYNNKITGNNPRDRNPLALGLGLTRADGQIIGEMESMALISHGVNNYLKDVRGNTNSDWFLANMITSSQVIVDSKGRALLTEVSNTKKSKHNFK
jgi:DNA-directed RNA polymerase beta subunit